MSDLLGTLALILASVVFVVGLLLFTVFIYRKEKNTKEHESVEDQKKIYRSMFIIGIIFLLLGALLFILPLFAEQLSVDLRYFGMTLIGISLIVMLYSGTSLYNVRYKK